jgi:hypothetical protein
MIAFVTFLILLGMTNRAVFAQNIECQKPVAAKLDYATLTQVIEKCDIRTVEKLLPLLPEDYRSSFTLMRKSGSNQEAGDENPRVILFGKDAKLILAFNGANADLLAGKKAIPKGFDKVEVIEYDEKNASFGFKEIEFKGDTQKALINSNPKSCNSCHGDPARPNWEAYNYWAGAYGALDDHIKEGTSEDIALKKWLKNRKANPRYQHLVLENESMKSECKNKLLKPKSDCNGAYSVSGFPNFRFTMHLNQLNYKRIAKMLRESPDFEKYKYAIFAAGSNCPAIETFLPPQELKKFSHSPAYYEKATRDSMKEHLSKLTTAHPPEFAFHDENSGHDLPFNFELDGSTSHYITEKLRYLMEGRGISIDNWALSPVPGAFAYSDGEVYFIDVLRDFDQEMRSIPGLVVDDVPFGREYAEAPQFFGKHATDFKDFKRYGCCSFGSEPTSTGMKNCRILRKLSLASFPKASTDCPDCKVENAGAPAIDPRPITDVANRSLKIPKVVQGCLKCHSGPDRGGPNIPLDHPTEFVTLLKENPDMAKEISHRIRGGGYSQMPPERKLSAPEIKEVEKYVSEISSTKP